MMKELIRGIKKQTKLMIDRALSRFIYQVQVKDIVYNNNKVYISGTELIKAREMHNIKLTGTKLGNGRGFIAVPNVGDIILVLNLFGEFFYISSIYDEYSNHPDNHVQIKPNQMYLINKEWGSYLLFDDNDDVSIHTQSGAKFKLEKDGSCKLFDKNNYGFQCDGNGNVTIFGDLTIHGSVSDLEAGGNAVTSNNVKSSGNF